MSQNVPIWEHLQYQSLSCDEKEGYFSSFMNLFVCFMFSSLSLMVQHLIAKLLRSISAVIRSLQHVLLDSCEGFVQEREMLLLMVHTV